MERQDLKVWNNRVHAFYISSTDTLFIFWVWKYSPHQGQHQTTVFPPYHFTTTRVPVWAWSTLLSIHSNWLTTSFYIIFLLPLSLWAGLYTTPLMRPHSPRCLHLPAVDSGLWQPKEIYEPYLLLPWLLRNGRFSLQLGWKIILETL